MNSFSHYNWFQHKKKHFLIFKQPFRFIIVLKIRFRKRKLSFLYVNDFFLFFFFFSRIDGIRIIRGNTKIFFNLSFKLLEKHFRYIYIETFDIIDDFSHRKLIRKGFFNIYIFISLKFKCFYLDKCFENNPFFRKLQLYQIFC